MSVHDKAEQETPESACQPATAPESQTPLAQSEQPKDGELSDRQLEKVSGGKWRLGKWYPY